MQLLPRSDQIIRAVWSTPYPHCRAPRLPAAELAGRKGKNTVRLDFVVWWFLTQTSELVNHDDHWSAKTNGRFSRANRK